MVILYVHTNTAHRRTMRPDPLIMQMSKKISYTC